MEGLIPMNTNTILFVLDVLQLLTSFDRRVDAVWNLVELAVLIGLSIHNIKQAVKDDDIYVMAD